MIRRTALAALLLATPLLAEGAAPNPLPEPAAAAKPAGPPASRRDPVSETIHGSTVVDPYRWLEGSTDAATRGQVTPEVAAWTDAQNAYTREVLDHLPGRAELEAKLRPLMEVGSVTAPVRCGDRYFYRKREGDQNQPLVYVRDGWRGTPRVLLDPAKLDASGLTTISWIEPSHDGRLLAYGTYRAGDENATLHVLDVEKGATLADEIPGKTTQAGWLPDGSGFVYRNLADARNPYTGQVKLHRLGEPVAKDLLLMRQYTKAENEKLAVAYGPYFQTSHDGRWLLLTYAIGAGDNDLYAVDMAAAAEGEVTRVPVLVGAGTQIAGHTLGDTAYLWTKLDAPNGRVVAVDLRHPARESWKTLVPERRDAAIHDLRLIGDTLVVEYLRDASTRFEVFGHDGTARGAIRLPGIGTASIEGESDASEAYVSFESFNYPDSVFRVDVVKPADEPVLWERPDVPVDPSTVEVEQEWFPSKDGTRVSMFVVHRKGMKRDGDNPTVLYGYGGFNVAMTPTFNASLFQWFDAGGVWVVANLRGGGEYGEAWHSAGMLAHKQNVFDDFYAAAEHLIATKVTRPARLAAFGGSNGGLLTGVALTQRPELWGAVIVAVPLLDMYRYQDFLMAKYWVPEYGSAEDPQQFAYLSKYSPYQHVVAGTKYPAVLLTAGENDARVHPLHARKMTALLQAATASDPATKPVLLWVDREAGHGQGKPLNLRIRDMADQRIFLMWQLGMLPGAPAPPAGEPAAAAAKPASGG